jgi:hypothetical protein
MKQRRRSNWDEAEALDYEIDRAALRAFMEKMGLAQPRL